ncbi:hypothetical protein VKT23_019233 [Stygiomarasmius scandens]|uniref:Transposase n=1 Tax=Marasmiellus scandens TaxID=2682957 RepID=A0ABR1ILX2_9AGAR
MSKVWTDEMRVSYHPREVIPAVGKFHEPTHIQKNHEQFSFNLISGIGHSNGTTLMRKYKAAVAERNLQIEAHEGWTSRLPRVLVDEWEAACIAWEKAPYPKDGVDNPFEITSECKCYSRKIPNTHF